jgi:hypothetical protein
MIMSQFSVIDMSSHEATRLRERQIGEIGAKREWKPDHAIVDDGCLRLDRHVELRSRRCDGLMSKRRDNCFDNRREVWREDLLWYRAWRRGRMGFLLGKGLRIFASSPVVLES